MRRQEELNRLEEQTQMEIQRRMEIRWVCLQVLQSLKCEQDLVIVSTVYRYPTPSPTVAGALNKN